MERALLGLNSHGHVLGYDASGVTGSSDPSQMIGDAGRRDCQPVGRDKAMAGAVHQPDRDPHEQADDQAAH
jgi:hypothetical protein